ncbi:MAG TPA: DoxX family protein [Gaiellaceae bacterium]
MHHLTRPGELAALLTETRGGLRAAASAFAIRIAAGGIFLVFGIGKFTDHSKETDSFDSYGLPFPGEFAYTIGVVEIVFGILLVLGLGTRLAALALAGDMVGAIVTAGRVEGGAINLVLAPALLAGMLALLWIGPGRWSLDRRLTESGAWSATL